MEFQSAYYQSFRDYMIENKINPADAPLFAPHVQASEDMIFGFTMFLIM